VKDAFIQVISLAQWRAAVDAHYGDEAAVTPAR